MDRRPEQASTGQRIPEKTLIAAIQQEPNTWDDVLTGASGSPRQGGRNQVPPLVDDGLTQVDEFNRPQRRLAAEMPDQEKGTWVLKTDGTMDVIWKLRSDAKWHDGTPVTSADFVFAYEARSNPESARTTNGGGRADLITGASAPDPHTFVSHWSVFYVEANGGGGLNPLPKHLLNELYHRSPVDLGLDKFFTTEYVGTGPYRLEQWEPGSHITFRRFEEHYLGPAKIARIIVKIIPDSNTQVANILSESVDVVLPVGVDLETAIEIKERWAQQGTGHQVVTLIGTGMEHLEIQYHPDRARPRFGLTETPVRKALYHAIDRPALAEAMTRGLAPIADSIYAPNDPYRPMVSDIIPQYPFDVRRAQELLEGAGWMRGPDGIRVHQTTGERFVVQNLVRPGNGPLKQGSIIADQWKAVGVETDLQVLTPALAESGEYLAKRPGVAMIAPSGTQYYGPRLLSSRIPREENRWTGNNRGNYRNPVVEGIVNEIAVTIDPTRQQELHQALVREFVEPVGIMPLFWQTVPVLMLRGVTTPKLAGQVVTLDINQWDKN